MSSWLSISLPNPFKSLEEEQEEEEENEEEEKQKIAAGAAAGEESEEGGDGNASSVREDLTELTKSIGRQLWGVASFLAPPPLPQPPTTETPPPVGPAGEEPPPPSSPSSPHRHYLSLLLLRRRRLWDPLAKGLLLHRILPRRRSLVPSAAISLRSAAASRLASLA